MTVQINNAASLSNRQRSALNRLVSLVADERRQTAAGHDVVISFDVETGYAGVVIVFVKNDIPSLGDNNLLRCLTLMDSWVVVIGERGALTAKSYPKSVKQFKGKRWCGINIR